MVTKIYRITRSTNKQRMPLLFKSLSKVKGSDWSITFKISEYCLRKLINCISDFLDDFYWSFSDNLPPDFFEFPNEAIVPLNYSNPIESLVFQKCSIISTSFFEIDQSLIINMVDNLLDHQRKSLTQFIHG